ncbi:MAG TPA: bifunctional 23S rRNA (guanine(2069)-N(7))-methyltransferase RlmK/23S rRNA (guanine(2445)-N(2))-methyltransferase RlmL [Sulfurivirga caldicuralii]|nr:bifunctional 23S rRNA (guanine(2069)-N(7))-methyltransferase RlmK/23S rRNA (guanine(2445)-N(2))-methyltransferase RlmL [Sulfurivirga caldicuralii]
MQSQYHYFATAPAGGVELLAEELKSLGAQQCQLKPTGVEFSGELAVGYRAVLWSRVANRIYLRLANAVVDRPEALYAAVQGIDWSQHMTVETPFAVSFTGSGAGIKHTHFGALKIKDAIVDQFRGRCGMRPPVVTEGAHLAIHAHLHRGRLQVFIDLSGFGLHQRGYRQGVRFSAPLKENVAAAVLLRCGWPTVAEAGGALVDPMCGSGTFLVEAAWMVQQRAPQLNNVDRMSLLHWQGHVPALWQRLVAEAQERFAAHRHLLPKMVGRDISAKSLAAAHRVLAQADLADQIQLQQAPLRAQHGLDAAQGLVVCNPPYGERLGVESELNDLYQQLGELLKRYFVGWRAGVFTCRGDKVPLLGLRPLKQHPFRNGALECVLARYAIQPAHFRHPPLQVEQDLAVQVARRYPDMADSEGARMFANRLRKNLRRLKGWLKQAQVSAFRAYDADIPEYALAVDVYDTVDDGRWVVVYEYAPPACVDPRKARRHLFEAMAVLPQVLAVTPEKIVYKVRQRQKGSKQYVKLAQRADFHQVVENGARLWVNFHDYLDTGLFLDHRLVRRKVARLSRAGRLLNLFCYTASASVEAAVAGAQASVSVDLSRTYLDWAARNFALNDLDRKQHTLIRVDVLRWLAQPPEKIGRFDVIFLDPPSFSTSKRMQGTLDIQRDHVTLIEQAGQLLENEGHLVFSTNLRRFKLAAEQLENRWEIEDWTQTTLPPDFQRHRPIHQVWRLRRRYG